MGTTESSGDSKKSVFLAYVFWLFGGLIGLHHLYLGRDKQAIVWVTTFGGFKAGWIGDITRIPRYVRLANREPKELSMLSMRMTRSRKPPFSVNRFTGMLFVGYWWGQMLMSAVPPEEFTGISKKYLNLLTPLAAALGVWIVGNIGTEKGTLKWPLLAAYAAYPFRFVELTDGYWFILMVLAAALAFDSFSKEWRILKVEKNMRNIKRGLVVSVSVVLYLSLWGSYLHFYGTTINSDGEEVPFHQAVHDVFTDSLWSDLYDVYQFGRLHGWQAVWNQVVDLLEPEDETHAFKVLGLHPDATQQEITSAWRRLSREHHPDKVKLELVGAAQERFMEIQRAYEILSKRKFRRSRKNRKDNSDLSRGAKVDL